MTKKDEYLDPAWQKKRLEVLERFEWKCVDCDEATKTLHVHHRYYVSGRKPWEYPDFCYVVKCKECHVQREEHEDGTVSHAAWEVFLSTLLPAPELPEFIIEMILDIAREVSLGQEAGLPPYRILERMMRFASELKDHQK